MTLAGPNHNPTLTLIPNRGGSSEWRARRANSGLKLAIKLVLIQSENIKIRHIATKCVRKSI